MVKKEEKEQQDLVQKIIDLIEANVDLDIMDNKDGYYKVKPKSEYGEYFIKQHKGVVMKECLIKKDTFTHNIGRLEAAGIMMVTHRVKTM